MFHKSFNLIAPAVQDRIVLLLNHVISCEPHAMARLAPFKGSSVVLRLVGWPSLLPPAPDLNLTVTPAGLWERSDVAAPEALTIEVDASNPALLALGALSGEKPRVQLSGDAAFAGVINGLVADLRWDIEDDLAAVVGPAMGHQLGRVGRAVADALAGFARKAGSWRPQA
jgi:ubiquinone biosynthesis protein UbiJ